MISREFVEWVASKPIRLIVMVFMVMTMTFWLVMTVGLHIHQAHLDEVQIQQIRQIEEEANRARADAMKAKAEALTARGVADKTTKDVKAIEKTIHEDR